MLSLPDFRQKQIVYIEAIKNKDIAFRNQNLMVKEDKKIIIQIPCGKIFAVFIVGNFTFSSVLVQKFQKFGISLFFLNFNFRCYGSFGAKTDGNVLLRKKQYTLLEKDNFIISQKIILNKCENQLKLLKNIRKKSDKVKENIDKIKKIIKKINSFSDLSDSINIEEKNPREVLLGYEGNIAKLFFSVYFEEMNWHGRKPRIKFDITNTLLDRGYTTLFNIVESLLKIYGFDIYAGIYHQFFYQRKSLVCDLVEPFRCIIDKALRKAYNLDQIDKKDFEVFQNKYVLPYKNSKKYSKIFLEAIMEHKEEIFIYTQKYYRSFISGKISTFPNFEI